jgi:hypothetical protein
LTKIIIVALCLLAVVGCGNPVEQAAEEGKNAFQTGMRTSEKAKDLGVQKEGYDRQADEF